jgi:hypothetical protein
MSGLAFRAGLAGETGAASYVSPVRVAASATAARVDPELLLSDADDARARESPSITSARPGKRAPRVTGRACARPSSTT